MFLFLIFFFIFGQRSRLYILIRYVTWYSFRSSDVEDRLFLAESIFRGFPGGLDGKESACNARDPGSIPGSGRTPGEGIECSCLENSRDAGAWWMIVHGVTNSKTRLSDIHFIEPNSWSNCSNITEFES